MVAVTANEIYLRHVRRELARRDVLRFNAWVRPDWITARHHVAIGDRLQAVLDGRLKRLIISMPPRHGKSLMASELFPALWLARNPTKNVIHCSYSSMLSNEFSRRVRAMIRDNGAYRQLFPHMVLHPERARIDDWKLVSEGGFKSIGVQGGIAGHGADLMIIDDPVHEGDEYSLLTLDRIWEWWLSAARTRLEPGAAVVVIMTRWHPLDLAGRLLDLAGRDPVADQWENLVLAALAGEDDPLGRAPGEALWPERVSLVDLHAIRSLSGRYFDALYQQNPSVSESAMFLEGGFRREACGSASGVWCFDLASTEKTRSDYNVFGRWVYDGDVLYLLQVERFRAEWPEVRLRILDLYDLYPDDVYVFPRQVHELLAVQDLRLARPSMLLADVKMPNDKIQRAMSYAALVESGRAVVGAGESCDYFVWEHCHFPDAVQHDDCVDMSSVATHYFGLDRRFDWKIVYERESSEISEPVAEN